LAKPVFKILACHHPFDLPEACATQRVVGGARGAIAALADCGTDLILSGHYHIGHTTCSMTRYATPHRSVLLVAAGTATSTRPRGQANAFNLVRLHAAKDAAPSPMIEITRY